MKIYNLVFNGQGKKSFENLTREKQVDFLFGKNQCDSKEAILKQLEDANISTRVSKKIENSNTNTSKISSRNDIGGRKINKRP